VPGSERIRPTPDARETLEEARQAKVIDAVGGGAYSGRDHTILQVDHTPEPGLVRIGATPTTRHEH
jgi:hypothetical protein